ncbi:MAG: SIS domain-containing protein, partial [Geminicoccaceae bacterium]
MLHGQAVLRTEAAAIDQLALGLGAPFAAAVALMATLEGRVVCTGMGKSGHVARKIAATLSSTGRPAMFVHPGEASHGDLGMITTKDAVLALSNSGETAELRDLILYTRRFA